MTTASCAETGTELEIKGDGTTPYINLDGLGGVYFVSEDAKQRWCARNVELADGRWIPKQAGRVVINGTPIDVPS